MNAPSSPADPMDSLLAHGFPTLHELVAEAARDPDGSRVAQWVRSARERMQSYAAEQTSKRRAEEAVVVARAYEVGAALVAALSLRGTEP